MTDLVTLEEYKTAENLQSVQDDLRIESLITSVSQLVKTYCGNSIIDHYNTNKVETFSINWNTNLVQLTESPVKTIVSVEERKDFGSSYSTVASTEYYADASTDTVYRVSANGQAKNWPSGPGAVKVTYTAGYEKCPSDLKLAVIDLITYYRKDHHRTARQTIAGATVENKSSSGSQANPAFPDHIKRVLDLYKNF